MSSGAPQEMVLHIAGALQVARSRIGVLYISADSERRVSVDGTLIGEAPITGEVLVMPGKHRVIARGDLCLGFTDVELAAGDVRRVKVPCKTAPVWRTPALITGAALSVVGIIVGGVTLSVSEDRRKEIDRRVQDVRDIGYVEPAARTSLNGTERERVDLLNASITSFLVGGTLLAATTGVFFGIKRRRPDEPAPLVGMSVGVGQAGLWMRW